MKGHSCCSEAAGLALKRSVGISVFLFIKPEPPPPAVVCYAADRNELRSRVIQWLHTEVVPDGWFVKGSNFSDILLKYFKVGTSAPKSDSHNFCRTFFLFFIHACWSALKSRLNKKALYPRIYMTDPSSVPGRGNNSVLWGSPVTLSTFREPHGLVDLVYLSALSRHDSVPQIYQSDVTANCLVFVLILVDLSSVDTDTFFSS